MIEAAERQLLLPPMFSSSGLFQRNLEKDRLSGERLTPLFSGICGGFQEMSGAKDDIAPSILSYLGEY